MLWTVLLAVWLAVEGVHALRAREAPAPLDGPHEPPPVVALRVGIGWGLRVVGTAVHAPMLTVYAMLLCVAVGLHSLGLLDRALAGLFGALHAVDPTFPLDGSFSIGTRVHVALDGTDEQSRSFQGVTMAVALRLSAVLFVLERAASLVAGERPPMRLRGKLALNLLLSGAVAGALYWALGPGMDPVLAGGGPEGSRAADVLTPRFRGFIAGVAWGVLVCLGTWAISVAHLCGWAARVASGERAAAERPERAAAPAA